MKWFERLCRLLEYGPLVAALVPTLLVLLAAGVILVSADSAAPAMMMPTVPTHPQG
jgi:hypothetical protein